MLFRHGGRERSVGLPLPGDVGKVLPVPHRQPGQARRPQSGRLQHGRAEYGHTEDVRLQLHQQAVGGGPAIDPQLGDADAGVGLHGFQDVGHLEGDGLQRRPS